MGDQLRPFITSVLTKVKDKYFNSNRTQCIDIDEVIKDQQSHRKLLQQQQRGYMNNVFQKSVQGGTTVPLRLQQQHQVQSPSRTFPASYNQPRLSERDLQQVLPSCQQKKRSAKFYEEMRYFTKQKLDESTDLDCREDKIRSVALTSRLILLVIQILSSALIPQHENDGFKTPKDNIGANGTFLDRLTNSTLGGFVNWDGEYFLHISIHGYTHENTMAFFPLFPTLVGAIANAIHGFCFTILPIISLQSVAQIVGWGLNTWCFMESAVALIELVKYFDHGLYNLDEIVLYLFCYNPASIFFSSYYSESLFTYLTIKVLLSLYQRHITTSIQFAALSAVCRSNGLLNFGYIGAFILRNFLTMDRRYYIYSYQKALILRHFSWQLVQCVLGLVPFAAFQIYCSWKFCGVAGQSAEDSSKLCDLQMLPYMYIQSKNWNVGFLRYFEWTQLPNFLLAAPVLCVLGYEARKRAYFYGLCLIKFRTAVILPNLALSVHGIFLTFFCLCCMHVQVSTRMILSSCPYLFIYIAKTLRTEICRHRSREINWLPYSFMIHMWCCSYFIWGTLLFSRGYPWT